MRPQVMWDYTTMIWRSPDSWKRFWHSSAKFFKFARSNNRLGES